MGLIEVVAPYSNSNIWKEHPYGVDGYTTSDRFNEWIGRRGLRHGGLWFDNSGKSTSEYCVLLFEKLSEAILFKVEVW
jgi:hypothetical protein